MLKCIPIIKNLAVLEKKCIFYQQIRVQTDDAAICLMRSALLTKHHIHIVQQTFSFKADDFFKLCNKGETLKLKTYLTLSCLIHSPPKMAYRTVNRFEFRIRRALLRDLMN